MYMFKIFAYGFFFMTVNQLQHGIRINLYGNQSLSKYEVNTLSNGKCEDVEIFGIKTFYIHLFIFNFLKLIYLQKVTG